MPSPGQEKCPTRGYSMVLIKRIGLSFCTKYLFNNVLTALLLEALIHVPNQQPTYCPSLAHYFSASSHQDVAQLSYEHNVASAQGCGDVPHSPAHGQQQSLKKTTKRTQHSQTSQTRASILVAMTINPPPHTFHIIYSWTGINVSRDHYHAIWR